MSSSISPIYKLSNDNLVNIFSFLDYDGRACAISVSPIWHTVINDHPLLTKRFLRPEETVILVPYTGGILGLGHYKRDNTDVMYVRHDKVTTCFEHFINQMQPNEKIKFTVHVPSKQTEIHISLSHGNPLNSNIPPNLVQQVVVVPEPEEEPAPLSVHHPISDSSSIQSNRLCLRELAHCFFGFPWGTSLNSEASIVKKTSEPTPFARPLRDELQGIGQARLNAIEEQQSRRINRQLIGLSVIIAIAAVVFKIATTFARSDS